MLPPGGDVPCEALNHLPTRVGCFNDNMQRWGPRPFAARICGPTTQNPHHMIYECPTLRLLDDITLDLAFSNHDTVSWLQRLDQTASPLYCRCLMPPGDEEDAEEPSQYYLQ